jgi:AraC-like DNA-binding protein
MAADLLSRHPVVATTELEVAREQVAARYCSHALALARRGGRLDLVHNAGAIGEDVVLNYMRYGDEVRITPGRFLDFYLVQVPLDGRARVRSGRRELVADRRTAFVGSPDDPVDMRWSADCAKLVVYIRRGAVEELGAPGLVFDPVLALDRPAARDWMRLLWLSVEQLEVGGELLRSPVVATSYEQTLVAALLALQPNSAVEHAPVAAPSHAVRTARSLIDGDPGRAWRVADLAELSGVSARTLQEAFHRELGTTPLAEVRRARLERARQDLVSADPLSTTVAVVAARWGFFHLGRFAQAYRDRFHELPSQTLTR